MNDSRYWLSKHIREVYETTSSVPLAFKHEILLMSYASNYPCKTKINRNIKHLEEYLKWKNELGVE